MNSLVRINWHSTTSKQEMDNKKAMELANSIYKLISDSDVMFWEGFGILEAVKMRIQDKA